MIHYVEILQASLEDLNAELVAAGRTAQESLDAARREAVALVHESHGPFDLVSIEGEILRKATLDEAIESCLAGYAGLISVDDDVCYVQP